MVGRIIGLLVTFGVIGWLFHSFFSSNSKVDQMIDSNPTVQEQKKALKDAGINADDKKELNKHLSDEVKKLQDYQNQADNLSKDPP